MAHFIRQKGIQLASRKSIPLSVFYRFNSTVQFQQKSKVFTGKYYHFKKLHFQKIQVEFSKNSVFQRAVIIGLHDLEEKSEATFATSRAEHYCSTEKSLIEKISR